MTKLHSKLDEMIWYGAYVKLSIESASSGLKFFFIVK